MYFMGFVGIAFCCGKIYSRHFSFFPTKDWEKKKELHTTDLQTVAALAAQAAVKTELPYRNVTITPFTPTC